jgi:hypothetical protein
MGCRLSRMGKIPAGTTTGRMTGASPTPVATPAVPVNCLIMMPSDVLRNIQGHMKPAIPAYLKRTTRPSTDLRFVRTAVDRMQYSPIVRKSGCEVLIYRARTLQMLKQVCKGLYQPRVAITAKDEQMAERWPYLISRFQNQNRMMVWRVAEEGQPAQLVNHGGKGVATVEHTYGTYLIRDVPARALALQYTNIIEAGGRLLSLFPIDYDRDKVRRLAGREDDRVGSMLRPARDVRFLAGITRQQLPYTPSLIRKQTVEGQIKNVYVNGYGLMSYLALYRLRKAWKWCHDVPERHWDVVADPYNADPASPEPDTPDDFIGYRPMACAGLRWPVLADRFRQRLDHASMVAASEALAEMARSLEIQAHKEEIEKVARETYWDDTLDEPHTSAITARIEDRLDDRVSERGRSCFAGGCFEFISQFSRGEKGVEERIQIAHTHYVQELLDSGKPARAYDPSQFRTQSLTSHNSTRALSLYDRLKVGDDKPRGCVGAMFESKMLRKRRKLASDAEMLLPYTVECVKTFQNSMGAARLEVVDPATRNVLGDKVTGWYRDHGWTEEDIALVHSATVKSITIPSLAELRSRAAQGTTYLDEYQRRHGVVPRKRD